MTEKIDDHWDLGFDSKLVRLKVKLLKILEDISLRFDSKLVRLKVESEEEACCVGARCFDSKLVRLKADVGMLERSELNVSIPNWFD